MILQKLALVSLRYPKAIIVVWTLFLIGFGLFAPKLPTVLKDHGLTPNGDHAQVERILSSDFHIPKDPVILLFEKNDSVSPDRFRQFIRQTLSSLQGVGGLSAIVSPLDREGMINGNFAYALLAFQQNAHEMKPVLEEIQRLLPNNREIAVNLTGKSVVQADVNRASRNDLGKAERIGIPAAFLILWLAFGGIVAALIPIVVGVIGVTGTMGMMYWLGTRIELSNFVLNVIPMVGLALSIDFALMLVSRFQEELSRESAVQALMTTMNTAGRAVLFSSVCVFLGLMGILFIPLPMFSSIAIGAMTVLTVSVGLTLTLVPALLCVLWPALRAKSKRLSRGEAGGIWYSLSLYVIRRPVRMGLLASFLLILCLLPLHKMTFTVPDATSLPQHYPSRIAFEAYQTHFSSRTSSPVTIVTQGKIRDFTKEDWLSALALVRRLNNDPSVQRVDKVLSGSRLLIRATLEGEPSSSQVRDWLRTWEQEGNSSALPFLLGGEAKYQQEVFDDIFHNLKYVLLFIFVSNYVVLFMAFRSLIIPLKTILMNLLSLGASFGVLAWIFDGGHLGMEPNRIAIMIPVFIFGLVFGISMDYGVFLLSRVFEVYQRTQNNRRAVLEGLTSISRMINSAAAIMIAVTVPFAFGEVVGVKQLGVGIAAAIFIDATIIRMVLVPSLLRMLGRWNWWAPGRFSKR
jgi:RND superfamily putative drug exporter